MKAFTILLLFLPGLCYSQVKADTTHVITYYDSQVIIEGLDKFRSQRTAGKLFQLAGTLGAVIYTGASIKDPEKMKREVIYASCGFVLFGFYLDIDAGKHLRIRPSFVRHRIDRK